MLINAVFSTFDVSRSNDDPRMFVLFGKLDINGIRPLAASRLAHKCTPLTA